MLQYYIDSRIYRLLTICGKEKNPYNLASTLAVELERIIPYDQARVIFINQSGKITSSMLYGVKQKNWNLFLDYYETESYGSNYSLKSPVRLSSNECVSLCDWTQAKRQSAFEVFARSYVKPLKLKYCLGIGLTDDEDCLRCILSLDRTRDVPYELEDIELVKTLHPLFNSLFVNLFVLPPTESSQKDFLLERFDLTTREREIADLIVNGIATPDISKRLCISINTTYKHIANMYKKMNVSNKAEFIYLMNLQKEN